MVTKIRPRRAAGRAARRTARRTALGGTAACMMLGLAACGSVVAGRAAAAPAATSPVPAATAGPAAPASDAPLCAGLAHVTAARITESAGLPAAHAATAANQGVVIRDQARARALATAMCGLPVSSHAPVNCPADFGGSYRVVFGAGTRHFPAVSVQSSGCRRLTGIGEARTTGSAFWTLLHRLAGTPPAAGASSGDSAPGGGGAP